MKAERQSDLGDAESFRHLDSACTVRVHRGQPNLLDEIGKSSHPKLESALRKCTVSRKILQEHSGI